MSPRECRRINTILIDFDRDMCAAAPHRAPPHSSHPAAPNCAAPMSTRSKQTRHQIPLAARRRSREESSLIAPHVPHSLIAPHVPHCAVQVDVRDAGLLHANHQEE